jgi:hypothetical protein
MLLSRKKVDLEQKGQATKLRHPLHAIPRLLLHQSKPYQSALLQWDFSDQDLGLSEVFDNSTSSVFNLPLLL